MVLFVMVCLYLVLISLTVAGSNTIYFIGNFKADVYISKLVDSLPAYLDHDEGSDITIDKTNHFIVLEHPGVYSVSVSITVKLQRDDTLSLILNANNGHLKNNVIKTTTFVQEGETTIPLNGIFKASKLDHISLHIKTNKGRYTITQQSCVTLLLLSHSDSLPGFSASLSQDTVKDSKDSMMENPYPIAWDSTSKAGSYSSSNLFLLSENQLIIEKSGLYFISSNIVIKNSFTEECYHGVKLYKNNKQTVMTISQVTGKHKKIFTVSFNHIALLNKGDILWLDIRTECLYTVISKDTRFGLQYVKQNNGFSLTLSKLQPLLFQKGWLKTDIENFAPQPVKSEDGITLNRNSISITQTSLIFISVNFLIMVPQNSTGLLLSLIKTNSTDFLTETLVSKNFNLISSSGVSLSQTLLSTTLLLHVTKGDFLTAMLYLPINDRYMLLNNSTISGVYLNEKQIFNQENKNPMTLLAMRWNRLLISERENEFFYLKDNIIKVMQTGIYHITASVTLKGALKSEIYFSLIYDNEISSKRKEVITVKESCEGNILTLKFASNIRINIGQFVAIYIKSSQTIEVQTSIQVGLYFLGAVSNIIGFQANLLTDHKISKDNEQTVQNFYDSNRVEISRDFAYNTGNTFDHSKGVFIAPLNGVYILCANIVVKNIKEMNKEDYITIYLDINDKQSTMFLSKRSHLLKKKQGTLHITYLITGVVKLNIKDELSLKIKHNIIEAVVIDKLSSFSIVYINHALKSYGLLVNRGENQLRQQRDYLSIAGWKMEGNTFPYGGFLRDVKNSPQIIENEYVQIEKSGHYIVTYNIILSELTNTSRIQLSIKKTTRYQNTLFTCLDTYSLFSRQAMSCSIIIGCSRNDRLSIQLRTTDGSEFSRFLNNKEDYVSVILLPEPLVYQSIVAALQESNVLKFSNSPSILKPWQQRYIVSNNGDNGFSPLNGILHTRGEGWFLFTANLNYKKSFGNVSFSLNDINSINNNLIESVASASIDNELPLLGVIYLKRSTKILLSYKGFGPGSVVNTKTYYSLCYLSDSYTQKYGIKQTFKTTTSRQAIKWKLDDKFYSETDLITLKKTGVYIMLSSITVTAGGDDISFELNLNEGERRFIQHSNGRNNLLTFIIAGVFVIKSSKSVMKVYINSKEQSEISLLSTLSVSYIHPKNDLTIAIMEIKKESVIDLWVEDQWYLVTVFESLQLDNLFYQNSKFIVKSSGLYFISVHLMIQTGTTERITLGIFIHNECILMTTRTSSTSDTLSIVQTFKLKQGSMLALKVKSTSETKVKVKPASSFNMLLIESFGEKEESMLPVITNELYPGSDVELGENMSATLQCNAVGANEIRYVWYRDNKRIIDHSDSVLTLHNSEGGGKYQCQAVVNDIGPISKATQVTVKDINECLTDNHRCQGDNVTCVNTMMSYYCSCTGSLVYKDGICTDPNQSTSPTVKVSNTQIISLLLLILIPIGSLICILLIGATICLGIRQRHRRQDDAETIAFTNYNENTDDIALQNLSLESFDLRDGGSNSIRDNVSFGTLHSYTPSNIYEENEDDDDIGGFQEHKWKKLKVTTSV